MLAKYEDILQGGAERIFRMAERESEHRMKMESDQLASDSSLAMRGQWIGLAAVLASLCLAGYMAYLDEAVVAAVIAGLNLVGLAGVFVYGGLRRRAAQRHMQDTDDEGAE